MLSLASAQLLKAAGLEWSPAMHDFFALPDRGLDDRSFVITDLPANIAQLHGQPVFTFEGAAEWAMDYIVTSEAVWLPTEGQLRLALEARLPDTPITLSISSAGYECGLEVRPGVSVKFRATAAEDAYAAALLYLLQRH